MERVQYMITYAHVVRAGSFVGASEKLKLAPSVVSKHVSKLEQDLGVRLLNRTTRSLSQTEAGAAFYQHCARILEELEQSEQAVASLQAEPQGLLRISTTGSIVNSLVAPMIPDFLHAYPQIELEMVASEHLVDLVEDGFDMALRITGAPASHLVARRLAPVSFHVMASPDYLRRHGKPTSLADLDRHVCLNYPEPLTKNWLFEENGKRVEVEINSPVRINSVEALRQLALAGVGLALLPVYAVVKELDRGELLCTLPDHKGFGDAALFAVYMPNRYGSPKLKAFVDYVTDHIRGLQLDSYGCSARKKR